MKRTIPFLLCLMTSISMTNAAHSFNLDFDNGASNWRVVVDGVMGGRSSGRVTSPEPGILRFTGRISLENNGGFSQVRTNVNGSEFAEAEGVEIRVRGDGRTYKFDVRCSNVRLMAGAYQAEFATEPETWKTIRIPFNDFRLYNFGQRVSDAPAIKPELIESIGVTLADKKEGSFELELDSIRSFSGSVSNDTDGANDLLSVARAAGLTTLADLVEVADIANQLPTDQRLTILAPTNEAFAAIPAEQLESLPDLSGRSTLQAILSHHVATPALDSSTLLSRRALTMLDGQRVDVAGGDRFSIDGANFVTFDVPFNAGVVHVIDLVIMPELRSIADLVALNEDLSTLASAVAAADLLDQLGNENGPWTIFAPVNSAFDALPMGTLDSLTQPESRMDLVNVLGLHVVPGRIYSDELPGIRSASTLFGKPVEFSLTGGRLKVESSTIVKADIEASNGVIHLVDGVLLPDTSESGVVVVESRKSAEAARILSLAVERGARLFNMGQHEACAAIYEVAIKSILGLAGDDLDPQVRRRFDLALAEGETEHDAAARAWTYRRAIDAVIPQLVRDAGDELALELR